MANPWLERRVLAYAHQGGAKEAPSSTIYAIEQALAAGADAVELDVHMTADGVLVVCHDATLERTTDGSGRIAEHTWSELARLDNAYWFVPGEDALRGRPEADYPLRGRAPEQRELGLARLDEVIERFPGVPLTLDIKQTDPEVPAYEEAVAELLVRRGRVEDVIVASFNDRSTSRIAELAPAIGTSPGSALLLRAGQALLSGGSPDEEVLAELRRHVAVQVPPAYGSLRVVDERFVEFVHGIGLAVHVWTIDEAEEMRALLEAGVDGIMTDRPSVLAGVLASR